MGRGKKPLLEKVEIQKIAAEGKSIAYIDEKVLFVPNTLPGDIVDVQVTRKRKNFMEGIVTHTHRFSALRIAPFRHLRRMQMAKSPLRKTIGIQTAGNQRQFATHRKNKTTKCLSDHRICPPTLLPQQARVYIFE